MSYQTVLLRSCATGSGAFRCGAVEGVLLGPGAEVPGAGGTTIVVGEVGRFDSAAARFRLSEIHLDFEVFVCKPEQQNLLCVEVAEEEYQLLYIRHPAILMIVIASWISSRLIGRNREKRLA